MGEHGGVPPSTDVNDSNNYSISGATVEFDAVEHPLELELASEANLGDGDEREEDEQNSDDEGEAEVEGEEAEYTFQFQGEMDPLSFVEEDASGLLPYERFERIEHHYEVLASKKRSALQQCASEMPPKRMRIEEFGASFQEIMEAMNYGTRRKSRKAKQRGRRKGTKGKADPEVTRRLGQATLDYAHGRFEEATKLLMEVILVAPNLSDPYHTLGLINTAKNDKTKAVNFYMIAAHLTPKDASLWKLLVSLSIELGDKGQANYCLNKAITADPEDIGLQKHRASLYVELGENLKAADSYEKISRHCPDEIEVLRKATQLYQQCGQHERAVNMLEDNLRNHKTSLSVVDLLASVLMDIKAYARALEHIKRGQRFSCIEKEIPLSITIKSGICHVHLGNLDQAQVDFNVLRPEHAHSHAHLIIDAADSLVVVGKYDLALKYYLMLEEDAHKYNGYLHLKIARCYASLRKGVEAMEYYHKAIQQLDDSVEARLMLSSLLLEKNRDDEAISVLSPPEESDLVTEPDTSKVWWRCGKIKLKLAQIYKAKGSIQDFADVLFPVVLEALSIETIQQKAKARRRLSRGVLSKRVKVLDYHQPDNVFHGFRPVASTADLHKASRAKRILEKKEAKRTAALAAGIDCKSDDSDDESPQVLLESPLPDLLKEEGDFTLIIDLCKSLSTLGRYWDASEIIKLTLKLECSILSAPMKEELRTLEAQMAYNFDDPNGGWESLTYVLRRDPHSCSAWNCYYKRILRHNRILKRSKFLYSMRVRHKDSVPPILIYGHQFTLISQHQTAAREYLEAYKLMPDNPLINLCAGTALINLTLSHRLQNKHQTVLQGVAFLYNNARLCGNSQEALYNIARAYHNVGLFSLAATYYERVLAMKERDYPIPILRQEAAYNSPDLANPKRPGYCDLRREAAYNLHLIYKKSGALDLARQVLKDYVVL